MNRRTKASLAVAALAASAVILSACSSAPPVDTKGHAQKVTGYDGGYGAELVPVSVQLDKGRTVECVALVGPEKGGLSCDWAGAKR